jgi:uncharacterized cupredoxin-like copper-binding protein
MVVAVTSAVGALAATSKATVNVAEKEFTLTPVPRSAKPGKVTFVVKNVGKLDHEFVVIKTNRPPGKLPIKGAKASEAGRIGKIPPFKPGQTKRITLALKPGKYVLLCNVAGHYQAGQHSAFRVG